MHDLPRTGLQHDDFERRLKAAASDLESMSNEEAGRQIQARVQAGMLRPDDATLLVDALNELYTRYLEMVRSYDEFEVRSQPSNIRILRRALLWSIPGVVTTTQVYSICSINKDRSRCSCTPTFSSTR